MLAMIFIIQHIFSLFAFHMHNKSEILQNKFSYIAEQKKKAAKI